MDRSGNVQILLTPALPLFTVSATAGVVGSVNSLQRECVSLNCLYTVLSATAGTTVVIVSQLCWESDLLPNGESDNSTVPASSVIVL